MRVQHFSRPCLICIVLQLLSACLGQQLGFSHFMMFAIHVLGVL